MRIEFDRDTCIGMYQCVAAFDAFEKNPDEGKADLAGSEAAGEDLYVLEVPESDQLDAEMAARACPVDAIAVYDGDERVV